MFTLYTANRFLNFDFRGTDITPKTNLYLGLSTTHINKDGSNITEPASSTGYTRVVLDVNMTNWSVATNGELQNNVDIMFAESVEAFGEILDIFIADSSTGGNILYYQPLDTPKNIDSLSTVILRSGGLIVKSVEDTNINITN